MVARPVPGIRFLTGSAAPRDSFPRMDVAFLVGFARKGPCDLPVAVESVREYEDVFGGEVELAWDPSAGGALRGHLPGAVRQFFANGGRRAWIVRVLDVATARKRHFQVPSVLEAAIDGAVRVSPVSCRAREFGSWSDRLRLSSRTEAVRLERARLQASPSDPTSLDLVRQDPSDLETGDLVAVHLAADTRYLAPVASVAEVAGGDPRVVRAKLGRGLAIRRVGEGSDAPSGECRIALFDRADGENWTESRYDAKVAWSTSGTLEATASIDPALSPSPGTVGRIRWKGGASAWLRILESTPSSEAIHAGLLSVRILGEAWEVNVPHLEDDLRRWIRDRSEGLDRFRLELAVQGPGTPAAATGGMAMATAGALGFPGRFPLEPPAASSFLFPLGDLAGFLEGTGPLPEPAPALERDGLGTFDRSTMLDLFLDADLRGELSPTLADRALGRTISVQSPPAPVEPPQEGSGRAARAALRAWRDQVADRISRGSGAGLPRGIHAMVAGWDPGPSEEATLLSVPDAVHPGWRLRENGSGPWWVEHPPEPDPVDPPGIFQDCRRIEIFRPTWEKGAPPDSEGRFELRWSVGEVPCLFELQESVDPASVAWRRIFLGYNPAFVRHFDDAGTRRYRVRAVVDGVDGFWSAVAEARREVPLHVVSDPVPDGLAAVHRAMMRSCAARGDSMAILTLPVQFRWDDAARHAARLRDPSWGDPEVPAVSVGEPRVLSQGILVHPWIRTLEDLARPVPADGATVGLLAATSSGRGAWIAPGRSPLFQAIGTELVFGPGDLERMREAQVSVLGCDPGGTFLHWADTLGREREEIPANVRRFMGLLRRMCLRRGAEWVFEPAGPVLERTVERSLVALLEDFRRRGALRGTGEGSSYRVDVRAEPDLGLFRVDLRVAPSLPLTWLELRLQALGDRLVAQEAG